MDIFIELDKNQNGILEAHEFKQILYEEIKQEEKKNE